MRWLRPEQEREWEEIMESLRWPRTHEILAAIPFGFALVALLIFEVSRDDAGVIQGAGMAMLDTGNLLVLAAVAFGVVHSVRLKLGERGRIICLVLALVSVAFLCFRFMRPLLHASPDLIFNPPDPQSPGLLTTLVFGGLLVVTLRSVMTVFAGLVDRFSYTGGTVSLPLLGDVACYSLFIVFCFVPFSI